MPAEEAALASPGPAEMRPMLRQLQDEASGMLLPALHLAGCALLATTVQAHNPLQANLPGLVLYFLPIIVWVGRRWQRLLANWVLVAGCGGVVLSLVAWRDFPSGLPLLGLAAGLAALTAGVAAGVAVATALTVLLALAPAGLLPVTHGVRLSALVSVWGTLGLIWLTMRPLATALEWSWSSSEQSRRLLERARDYQAQLKETLRDLADANLQLTRLNRLAQGLRAAAEEARRAKEQFVANVSHELRTPLNMIIGYSEMIVRAPRTYGSNLPPALLADLDVILRNSQHLSSLIDDVLDLSQIEAGKIALTRERVVLREILEAAATAVRPLYQSKGLSLELEIAGELPPVLCDRTRIREVALNLLSNAGRFTEQGGVQVRAWQEGADVVVSVADTGPGIPAGDVDKLFRPFEQVDGSARRRFGGTGLGLAISKSFVELHGGTMWLESRLGKGTASFFRLPIETPSPDEPGAARWFSPFWHYEERTHRSLAPAPVVHPRVVALESGHSLQRLLSRYQDTTEVVRVASLEEATKELARVPAQALLINDLSVSGALERLKQPGVLPYGTPAVVCSIPDAQETVGALEIADYLVKPVSREALLATLDRLALAGKSILVVDDEPEALRLFQRMLASARRGYRVLRAANGRQALDVLHNEQVDAMLLDLVMPDMDGFRVLEARSQDPALKSIPAVVISARDPTGQPIVSEALAVARGGGISVPQLLACIQGLTQILGTAGQAADPGPTGTPSG